MPIMNDGRIDYTIPQEIKEKFTREVMVDFFEKVIETFKENDRRQGREPGGYEEYSYYHWWIYLEGSSGFCESFRYVCKKHGLDNVLKYYDNLYWYDSDIFDGEFSDLLIHFDIVTLGNPEDSYPMEDEEDVEEQ